jgi:hypothetical protein
MKDRPLADVAAAERKLPDLANAMESDHAGKLPVGALNKH